MLPFRAHRELPLDRRINNHFINLYVSAGNANAIKARNSSGAVHCSAVLACFLLDAPALGWPGLTSRLTFALAHF